MTIPPAVVKHVGPTPHVQPVQQKRSSFVQTHWLAADPIADKQPDMHKPPTQDVGQEPLNCLGSNDTLHVAAHVAARPA
eukprot:6079554-Amphidinium_carterae.1